MLDTKLIILEGLPGSGKTTMSRRLFDRIDARNKRLVTENSEFNPITSIGERAITDIDMWQAHTLLNWEKLAEDIANNQTLYVMEFVWFQHSIAEMLMINCAANQIVDFCRNIETIIKDVPPVLILFTADDTETFLRETSDLRVEEGWKTQIEGFIETTAYGKARNLKGFEGFLEMFDDYSSIVETVYNGLQIDRVSIDVTKRDWPTIERATDAFLGLRE